MPVFYVCRCAPISFLLSRVISQRVFVDRFKVLGHLIDHFQLSFGAQSKRREMVANVLPPIRHCRHS
jgi:hypothetical protein